MSFQRKAGIHFQAPYLYFPLFHPTFNYFPPPPAPFQLLVSLPLALRMAYRYLSSRARTA